MYLRKAREWALSAEVFAPPSPGFSYDLRHAAVSTWLNAGVPATQVAEWAGHSVECCSRSTPSAWQGRRSWHGRESMQLSGGRSRPTGVGRV